MIGGGVMDMNYAKIMYEPSLQHHFFRLDPPYNIKKKSCIWGGGGAKKCCMEGGGGSNGHHPDPPPQLKMEQPSEDDCLWSLCVA